MNGTLSPEERGFVAGLLRLGLEKPALDRVLASEGVVAAWADLKALSEEQRVTAAVDLVREVVDPRLAALHPTWVRQALATEPTGLALAMVQGTALAEVAGLAPAGEAPWRLAPELLEELRRVALCPLEPLLTEADGPLGRSLAELDPETLEQEVCRWGARTVGASLAGAPLELRARAMASAGAPWSVEIAGAAARPTEPAARDRARQLIARAAALPALTSLHRLRAVGLLALGAALAAEGPASARRVAGRLPGELGRALLGT